MATLTDVIVPTITTETIGMNYVVDRGEKGRDTIAVVANLSDGSNGPLLPARKADAINMAVIWDACAAWVGQVKRADFAGYTAELKRWGDAFKAAVEGSDGRLIVRLLRDKPEKPDLSDDAAALIAPFVRFMATVQAAWSGATKHTLRVLGSGKDRQAVVWTGTLSSLTRRTPTTGIIAKGRKVR